MSTVFENMISGERQTSTSTGIEITTSLIVTGIPSAINGYGKISEAIRLSGAWLGMPHPVNYLARLTRIDGRAVASDTVELELDFIQNLTEIVINIQSAQFQTETNKALLESKPGGPEGLISCAYQYAADYELDTNLRGKVISKSPTIPKDKHDTVITVTREEVTTPQSMMFEVERYVDTLNQAGWTLFPAAPAECFKCMDISANFVRRADELNPLLSVYMVNRAFVFRPILLANEDEGRPADQSQFHVDVFYRDDRTGEPPADVVFYSTVDENGVPDRLPGGIRTGIRIYPQRDFNNLISV